MDRQVSRVQLIKSKFENLSVKDDTSFVNQKTNPLVFRRSQTSLNLKTTSVSSPSTQLARKPSPKAVTGSKLIRNKFQRQTDDTKRASIKRSNAFRKSSQMTSVNLNTNLTDTLKKALRQPLPKGPPPKKPPRTFKAQIKEATAVANGDDTKPKLFAKPNLLSTFHCNDYVIETSSDLEPIYMEPFTSGCISTSVYPLNQVQGCANHGGDSNDLHYMCTMIADAMDEDKSSEKELAVSAVYNQINSIVDVAFRENGSNMHLDQHSQKEPFTKLKRSITEKRKDYVKRAASKKDEFRRTISTLYTKDQQRNRSSLFKSPLIDQASSNKCPVSTETDAFFEEKLLKVEASLFTSCCLIGFNNSTKKPYMKWKFPSFSSLPDNIEEFVFPTNPNMLKHSLNQNFMQIFTDINGNRLYGYCRRVLPEASDILLPLCYIMISNYLAPGLYFKLLREVEGRHGQTNTVITGILEELYTKEIPTSGAALYCSTPMAVEPKILSNSHHTHRRQLSLENHPLWLKQNIKSLNTDSANQSLVMEAIYIKRPTDLRLESTDLSELHQITGTELLLNIFGTLLLERKVILISKNISALSTSIIGLTNLLYPFVWQYPLVACLPNHLIEICEAPIPLLIGCTEYLPFQVENGMVIDLDNKTVIQKCDDEDTILPFELRKSLTTSLDLVDILDESDSLSNVLIAEAFLRFFIELLSDLHISAFDKTEFLESQSNTSIKLFLEWFVETAMFHHFLTSQYKSKEPTKNQHYTLFFNKLNEKCNNNFNKSVQCIEALIRNCYVINSKKSKTFSERLKKMFST